jgi:hypothetical protein
MVQKIVDFCGDELQVVTYERFRALNVQDKSLATSSKALGSYKNVSQYLLPATRRNLISHFS